MPPRPRPGLDDGVLGYPPWLLGLGVVLYTLAAGLGGYVIAQGDVDKYAAEASTWRYRFERCARQVEHGDPAVAEFALGYAARLPPPPPNTPPPPTLQEAIKAAEEEEKTRLALATGDLTPHELRTKCHVTYEQCPSALEKLKNMRKQIDIIELRQMREKAGNVDRERKALVAAKKQRLEDDYEEWRVCVNEFMPQTIADFEQKEAAYTASLGAAQHLRNQMDRQREHDSLVAALRGELTSMTGERGSKERLLDLKLGPGDTFGKQEPEPETKADAVQPGSASRAGEISLQPDLGPLFQRGPSQDSGSTLFGGAFSRPQPNEGEVRPVEDVGRVMGRLGRRLRRRLLSITSESERDNN